MRSGDSGAVPPGGTAFSRPRPARRPGVLFASGSILLLVIGLRLMGSVRAEPSGSVALVRLLPNGADVELTLAPRGDVTMRWTRALEHRLTDFARLESGAWKSFEPALDAEGSKLAVTFIGGIETTLRWSVRSPERWNSPVSGIARADFLALPATTLLPVPDGPDRSIGRVALHVENRRGAHERVLLPTGPLQDAGPAVPPSSVSTIYWTPRDSRWIGGLFVAGVLSERVSARTRAVRVWSVAGALPSDPLSELASSIDEASVLLGSAASGAPSDLVVAPAEYAPLAGARTAWRGTHLIDARADVEREAVSLAMTRLLSEITAKESLWLVHGLRSCVPAYLNLEGDERHAWRLDLWERYSSLRAWGAAVRDEPATGPTFVTKAWAEIAAPLAVEHMLERSMIPTREALRLLVRIARSPVREHARRIDAELGPRAAAFHDRHVASFELMPPPRGITASTSIQLPDEQMIAESERFVFVATANQYGYLETCGCVLNQSGGAARRNAALIELRREHPDAIIVDAGNFLAPPTDHATVSTHADVRTFWETLMLAPYDAIAASPTDLGLLLDALPDLAQDGPRAGLVAGNARAPGDRVPWLRAVTFERAAYPVSVFGWSGLTPEEIDTENWLVRELLTRTRVSDPFPAVARWLEALPETALRVVAGQLSPALVEELVARFPEIDVVLSARYHAMTPSEKDPDLVHLYGQSGRIGDTLVLYATSGYYGMTVFDAGRTVTRGAHAAREWISLRERTIELGEHVVDHAPTRERIEAHYERAHPPGAWELEPLFPAHERRIEFAGSESCSMCHADIYRHWQGTGHGTAYETLLAARRQYVPECVRCHVVGLGIPSGFRREDGVDSNLAGVGCEQCHGPGGEHVERPTIGSIARSLPRPGCVVCHDDGHSPSFAGHENEYLARIGHW